MKKTDQNQRTLRRKKSTGALPARSVLPTQSKPIVVAVVLFAVLSSIGLLTVSRAATPYASLEGEQGTIALPAVAVNDTTASGGQTVVFTASATPPPPSDVFPGYAKPDATNTGPTGSLVACSDRVLDTPGQVVANCIFTGTVEIKADNVRLENSRVIMNGTAYGVRIYAVRNAVIDKLEIDGGSTGDPRSCVYDQSSVAGTVIKNTEMRGCVDFIKAKGGVIQGNWMHDPYIATAGHEDCIQVQFGTNFDLDILGNNCDMNPDGRKIDKSIQLGAETTSSSQTKCLHTVRMEGNWFGAHNSYINGNKPSQKCYSGAKNIARNNYFYRMDPALGSNSSTWGVINHQNTADVLACNKWESTGMTRVTDSSIGGTKNIAVTKDQLVPGSAGC